jgi:hypothetical protein
MVTRLQTSAPETLKLLLGGGSKGIEARVTPCGCGALGVWDKLGGLGGHPEGLGLKEAEAMVLYILRFWEVGTVMMYARTLQDLEEQVHALRVSIAPAGTTTASTGVTGVADLGDLNMLQFEDGGRTLLDRVESNLRVETLLESGVFCWNPVMKPFACSRLPEGLLLRVPRVKEEKKTTVGVDGDGEKWHPFQGRSVRHLCGAVVTNVGAKDSGEDPVTEKDVEKTGFRADVLRHGAGGGAVEEVLRPGYSRAAPKTEPQMVLLAHRDSGVCWVVRKGVIIDAGCAGCVELTPERSPVPPVGAGAGAGAGFLGKGQLGRLTGTWMPVLQYVMLSSESFRYPALCGALFAAAAHNGEPLVGQCVTWGTGMPLLDEVLKHLLSETAESVVEEMARVSGRMGVEAMRHDPTEYMWQFLQAWELRMQTAIDALVGVLHFEPWMVYITGSGRVGDMHGESSRREVLSALTRFLASDLCRWATLASMYTAADALGL